MCNMHQGIQVHDTLSMPNYDLNERVSIEGDLCTIRYIGELPNWPNQVALGIEWDEPARGKHDGELNGQRYFNTKLPHSGSFLKASSKKILRGIDFMDAIIATYGTPYTEAKEIKFGSKVVQSYGFQQLEIMQSDFQNLEIISLNRKRIGYNRQENKKVIIDKLSNLRSLDLSFNLINNLEIVWDIIDNMKRLSLLVLNGNRFEQKSNVNMQNVVLTLKYLSLTTTMITVEELTKLLTKFPNLEELAIAANSYDNSFVCEKVNQMEKLRTLDLSYNNFTAIPQSFISSNVENLKLSNNDIRLNRTRGQTWRGLIELDLRNNHIQDWDEIDEINRIFPDLKHLKINRNPLFNDISIEEMQINVIARIGDKLQKLNGTLLTQEEITNSELFFISKVMQNNIVFDKAGTRWLQLISKYGIKERDNEVSQKTISFGFNSKLIHLNLMFRGKEYKRTFLVSTSVLKLRGEASKVTGVSPVDIQLSYEFKTDDNSKISEILTDDLSSLSAFNFAPNQIIAVNKIQ